MSTKPNPTMCACESSQVKQHGHCAATNTLRVEFNSGTYDYEGVTAEQYADLQKAKSVGQHLNAHIKGEHKFIKHGSEIPKKFTFQQR